MSGVTLVIRGSRVVTPEGVRPAALHVRDGRISRVVDIAEPIADAEVVDAGELLVMPGVVDTHVHVNEPGRTDWEGFETATAAAAAGGVTTFLDMPLNSVPATTSARALKKKRSAAERSATGGVNVGFIGGVVPGNSSELPKLAAGGVRAFKCFLPPSGVEEFGHVTEADLRDALPVLAELGLPLMVHAEEPACLRNPDSPATRYEDYLHSRPVRAEHAAIAMLVRLLEWCATPVHVVHLSSSSSLALILEARGRGLPLTVETCPHYLTFAAEEIEDGDTRFKCAPPIREALEREALWQALEAGDIDLVASDHSPCPPELKDSDGDFHAAWGGISSLQLSIPAVWTGARQRGLPPEVLAGWMSAAPARLAGFGASKGLLAEGYDADVVIWDPDASFTVTADRLLHRHKLTPYDGRRLDGVVQSTWVGGRRVYAAPSRA